MSYGQFRSLTFSGSTIHSRWCSMIWHQDFLKLQIGPIVRSPTTSYWAPVKSHCLITNIYRLISTQLPQGSLKLFETKCLEALSPNPSKPPPAVSNLLRNGGTSEMKNGFRTSPPRNNVPNFESTNGVVSNGIGIYRPPNVRQQQQPSTIAYSNSNPLQNPVVTEVNDHHSTYIQNHRNSPIPFGIVQSPSPNGPRFHQQMVPQIIPVVMKPPPKKMVTLGTQTVSTGEIKILKVYEEPGHEWWMDG